MKELVLNGFEITNKEELHEILAWGLKLPFHYGKNLDALYDCLTDLMEDVKISLIYADALEENIGRTALGLQKVLKDAAKQNPHIILSIE